ncbi:hybrid sensor histidine kinase/response regulator [Candidatus Magnetaquicoccus inordinatus]|uniref:hybrid sensor histidine kinase/response regulator n=1 Tax=Candidatus Magnetaquicoccus inordinatus TaxID=2496818 RepID=UPI00102BE904|nr:hybrid sensor histidine kinase/response regulator [Candidatus Magnetaquicoccus inordinatus]
MALNRAQFVASFLADAHAHVGEMDRCLLLWERLSVGELPAAADLDGCFRAAHTLKGAARMMRFAPVSVLAHKMEDVLSALREQKISWSPRMGDLLFAGLDALRALLDQVASGSGELVEDERLCQALAELAASGGEAGGQKGVANGAPPTSVSERRESETGAAAVTEQVTPAPVVAAEAQAMGEGEGRKSAAPPRLPAMRSLGRSGDATIRMDAEQIDHLLQTVGESLFFRKRIKQRLQEVRQAHAACSRLMEAQSSRQLQSLSNQLQQTATQLAADATLLDQVLDALYTHTLEMRLLPLTTLFDMLPRLVRDLAKASGKEIQLQVRGGETRLDRVIIEKLGDVFLHLLRNAVDHGIELPEKRLQAGKPIQGTIQVLAGTQGGAVTIELRDDGKGIDLQRLQEVAVAKQIVSAGALGQLAHSELLELIFHPGLSTQERVTDLSGRGVGMDVVKRNIVELLQGSIRVESDPGQGTRFLLRLPLTLATVRVLLFRVNGLVLAIPGAAVAEIVAVQEEDLLPVVGGRALRLREQMIPVQALQSILGLSPSLLRLPTERRRLVLVLAHAQGQRGLLCDALVDEEVVVLKPLPYFMRRHPFASGMMISAQNEIVLVLDGLLLCKRMQEMGAETIRQSGESLWQRSTRHILVVDDTRTNREIEQAILQAAGYRVSLAENGEEGYAKAVAEPFDLVVTDVEMPLLDGFSLTRKLRCQERYRHTPIILVTSRDKEEDKRRGIAAGASAYIVKGAFDQSHLVDTVRNLLGE